MSSRRNRTFANAGLRELTVIYDHESETGTAPADEEWAWEMEIEYRSKLLISLPRDEKQADAAEWLERYG